MEVNITQADIDIVNKIINAKTLCEVMGIDNEFLRQVDVQKQLQKHYRKLCLKVHPDRNYTPKATDAFRCLTDAYNKLYSGQRDPIPSKIPPSYMRPPSYTTNNTNKPTKEDYDDFIRNFFKSNGNPYNKSAGGKQSNKKSNKKSSPKNDDYDDFIRNFGKTNKPKTNNKPTTNNNTNSNSNNTSSNNNEPLKPNCTATTKSDTRCKNTAKDGSIYCHKHQDFTQSAKPKEEKPDKIKCRAKTKAGKPCSKSARDGSFYCAIHVDYDETKPEQPKPEKKQKCGATTKAGNPCNNSARTGSLYCKMHSEV